MSEEQAAPEATPTEEQFTELDAMFEETFPESAHEGPVSEIMNPSTDDDNSTEEVATEETLTETSDEEPSVTDTSAESQPIDPSLIALAVQEGADQAQLDERIKSIIS